MECVSRSLGKIEGIEKRKMVTRMRKRLTDIALTILCVPVAPVAFAQPEVTIDKYCSHVTVDGVAGQIWRTTENGITTWAILDANRQYLADAPARCVEILGDMMRRQEFLAAPSIQPIPSVSNPPPKPIALSSEGTNTSDDIVAAHNRVRRAVGVSEKMRWSVELAAYAQEWADVLKTQRGCSIEHRPRTGQYAQKYGENLSWVSGKTQTGAEAVSEWASEGSGYDYKTGKCTGVCGHYTQIVWRSSRIVGCATASCQGSTKSQLWVCNYAPPGNVPGEKPY